ncbi:MAG: hypothetical protein HFI69_09910 [Lachnospiraceae bacterium]|nr:hypothetical protein [Lachnospiraceae bacterium]
MAKYVYPAIFIPEDKGMYFIFFPDIDDCTTCGDNLPHVNEKTIDIVPIMNTTNTEKQGAKLCHWHKKKFTQLMIFMPCRKGTEQN